MFDWFLKKKSSANSTASTFVESTSAGWSDLPESIPDNGGEQAEFVNQTLARAHAEAIDRGVAIGDEFKFQITDIPVGIASPHEIVFGLIGQAHRYGLRCNVVCDEAAYFVRLK
ncbi:hypothetical protein B7Y94_03470 [Candidatus Saccharibacteria bacterium 32-49-12]|nr:MAG: hypothetical protein B7Y94_03470 [Candidatus Saccharibacteria bacterium 32-49-12]